MVNRVFFFNVGVSDDKEEETLGGLLQLWTGWPSLPMLEEKLTVAFLPNTPNKVLAEADTCFKVKEDTNLSQ